MNSLIRFIQRVSTTLLFLVLLFLSLWLYISTSYYQKAQFGRLALGLSGRLAERVSGIGQYIRMREANIGLRQENVALKNELEFLRSYITLSDDKTMRYSRLTLFDTLNYSYIMARVVNNTVNHQQNYITLNVGRCDGVEQGMGVVGHDGVVGVVLAASARYSVAISLLNTDFKVSARHRPTSTFGSLWWPGRSYTHVRLAEIPLHVALAVGDTVVTSGHSAIFPRDVPIGSIVGYEIAEGNAYSIDVRLFADFRSLDYVYVVRSADRSERLELEHNFSPNAND
ncbi:MAG: rod shape-determining protein MreC [Bacteroidales bacterium]|nr:rod shape-determining protein MreC [Bacteroidales bacterium]